MANLIENVTIIMFFSKQRKDLGNLILKCNRNKIIQTTASNHTKGTASTLKTETGIVLWTCTTSQIIVNESVMLKHFVIVHAKGPV